MAHKGGPNHERWLVSYADFITLLFALFVVLFAASNADREKARKVARAVENAIEHSGVGRGAAGVAPLPREPAAPPKPGAPLFETYAKLAKSLQQEVAGGQVRIGQDGRGLVITLTQTAFFRSGAAEFEPAMIPALAKIAAAIIDIPNPVRLEGHTDAKPIHNERFNNNWELSSARAIAVLELLTGRFDMPPDRLAIAGYAETVPVAANDDEEGRARNRRVDIVVLNERGVQGEPGAPPKVFSGGADH